MMFSLSLGCSDGCIFLSRNDDYTFVFRILFLCAITDTPFVVLGYYINSR